MERIETLLNNGVGSSGPTHIPMSPRPPSFPTGARWWTGSPAKWVNFESAPWRRTAAPIPLDYEAVYDGIAWVCHSATAGAVFQGAIYADDGGYPGTKIVETAEISLTGSSNTFFDVAVPEFTVGPGLVWGVGRLSVANATVSLLDYLQPLGVGTSTYLFNMPLGTHNSYYYSGPSYAGGSAFLDETFLPNIPPDRLCFHVAMRKK